MSPNDRPRKRPRWLALYFVLAAVSIATVGASVAITFHLDRVSSASQRASARA